MTTKLNDGIMQSFHPRFAYAINAPHADVRVTSIKFSPDGSKLVAIGNDRNVRVYNCDQGTTEHTMAVQKYGGYLVDFMDTNDRVLITSNKTDFAVRELNFTKKAYQTIYGGHTGHVKSLSVHRDKRLFLTGSDDKSVALWDFRSQNPQSFQNKLGESPLVAFESTGNMFVVALPNAIQLYDLRGLRYGPFSEFSFNQNNAKWTNIKMSKSGKQILMSSCSSKMRLIDGYFGRIQREFETRRNVLGIPIDASFTPECDYILTGSTDGHVNVISNATQDGQGAQSVAEIPSNRKEAITSVEFNPRYTMFATASTYTTLWIPRTM